MRWLRRELIFTFMVAGLPMQAQGVRPRASFELATQRMDVDVDGAPTAYGPKGMATLDEPGHARLEGKFWKPIVGYVLDDDGHPVVQGPDDPAPGYYVSQTAYSDKAIEDERDPRGYLDATKINYVVLGKEAKKRGVKLGDFVAVYSTKTKRAVFGIVGDDGNPSGDEGSLHLLQDLGYAFQNGTDDAVEEKGEVVVRFYPGSNAARLFFRTQKALDVAARKSGLSKVFGVSRADGAEHQR